MRTIFLGLLFLSACSDSNLSSLAAFKHVDYVVRRDDGLYNVICLNGDIETGITLSQIKGDDVCKPLVPSDPSEPPAGELLTCESSYEDSAELNANQIDGQRIFAVTEEGINKSLCEIITDTGKDVAIFQLSSLLSFTCQDYAKAISEFLQKRENKSFSHSVIFTDNREDWSEEDFLWFMESFATGSGRFHDDDLRLIRQFSKAPNKPRLPTVVIMNRNMEASILNEDGVTLKDITSAATRLELQKFD